MKRFALMILFILILLVTACGNPAETPTPTEPPSPTDTAIPAPTAAPTDTPVAAIPTDTPAPEKDVIYLNIVWHQHQPLYYKDENGVYTRPWARAHATKDYYDMAALVGKYPNVHVTFNLTPVLIRQLDDLANGAKDYYRVLTEIPADQLTDEQKTFILNRFFDANWDHIIARFPGYERLLNLRGRDTSPEAIAAAMDKFTEQDFRDLQVWWNLAWFDPSFLAQEPLKSLVEKDHGFSEADKATIFAEVDRIIPEIIPLHKKLQDNGQIEVIITPYAHPILPLLFNTRLALVGDPGAVQEHYFSAPQDVDAQIQKAVDMYEEKYGQPVRGMWPAEGAVAQRVVEQIADHGFTWMASGEQVLAKSLGIDGFTRDSHDVVQQADALYRPYYVQYKDGPQVGIVLRDLRISDLVGFEYSGTPAQQAADDFINRIEAIRTELKAEGATGPHLVSVILDGENAWENYPNDGIDFLRALYQNLSDSDTIVTITPSEYLAKFPDQRKIDNLWPGAWFSSDYGTWIGEPEENTAWEYLRKTRKVLSQYDVDKTKETSPEKLAQAQDFMYLAEGSDWFWWYGSDQDSGNDRYFDQSYRALLKGVFTSLGEPVPDFVNIPIIPDQPEPPSRRANGPITPVIDGTADADEWANAGQYLVSGGSQARAGDVIRALYYGFDAGNFYFRLDADSPWSDLSDQTVNLYLGLPNQPEQPALSPGGTFIGFKPTFIGQVKISGGAVTGFTFENTGGAAALVGKTLELAIPMTDLGDPTAGDIGNLRVLMSNPGQPDAQFIPADGPAQFALPNLTKIEPFLTITEPTDDDNGIGTYTYPTDAVFTPGVFDATKFEVAADDKNITFVFDVAGGIENPWGSGINLSLQTFDIYIDKDPVGATGARQLLEGRNAALAPENGWDFAVWVEGWNQKVLVPNEAGVPVEVSGDNVKVIINPAGEAIIRVPRSVLGDGDPATWGYAAMVLSQEGFPAAGVRHVRDIEATSSQWRFGGAPNDTNHTRIIDLIYDGDQSAILGNYPPSTAPVGELTPDDFAIVPLVGVK